MHHLTEVLNDLYSLWVLTDIDVLTDFQSAHRLPTSLIDAFTEGDAVDRAVDAGVLIPMSGLVNQPYTLVVRAPDAPSVFDAASATLQLDRAGYGLVVRSGAIWVVTVPYLRDWRAEGGIARLHSAVDAGVRQRITVPVGQYQVHIRGGLVDGEATFEFVLAPVAALRVVADAAADFGIGSSAS